eukprot:2187317-Amphidinium_carterae.1
MEQDRPDSRGEGEVQERASRSAGRRSSKPRMQSRVSAAETADSDGHIHFDDNRIRSKHEISVLEQKLAVLKRMNDGVSSEGQYTSDSATELPCGKSREESSEKVQKVVLKPNRKHVYGGGVRETKNDNQYH